MLDYFVMFPRFQNNSTGTEVYLEELCVIVHKKQYQGFTLGSIEFMILNNCLLKSAADQGPVISLKQIPQMSVRDHFINC